MKIKEESGVFRRELDSLGLPKMRLKEFFPFGPNVAEKLLSFLRKALCEEILSQPLPWVLQISSPLMIIGETGFIREMIIVVQSDQAN